MNSTWKIIAFIVALGSSLANAQENRRPLDPLDDEALAVQEAPVEGLPVRVE